MAERKPANKRAEAEQRGRRAEYLAMMYLWFKGYRVLAHRAKTYSGELDLVCLKGKMVVIVEVKQRQTEDQGRHAVSQSAWQRISQGSESWLSRKGAQLYDMDRRYDVVIMLPRLRICHIRDAWRP